MTLLDRYLATIFLRNLALVLATLVGIYLLIDFIEKVDNFLEAGKSVALAGRYLLLKIPLICEQIMPVCLLLAVVISVGALSHNREILAMHCGGITLTRIIVPLLACVIAISLLVTAAAQWLTPTAVSTTNRIWYEEVKNEKARGTVIRGMTFHRGKNGIYSFKRLKQKNHFRDFSYVARDHGHRLSIFVSARKASWKDGSWLLSQVFVQNGDGEARYLEQMGITLPDHPDEFFQPPYHLEEQPLSTLFRDRVRDRGAALTLQKRLSYLFLGLPLVVLGLPLLILMIRRWQTSLALAIPASCVLAFIAWCRWSFSIAMAANYNASPFLFAWSAHLVCLTGGIFLFRQVGR